jgi:hypothetical protein
MPAEPEGFETVEVIKGRYEPKEIPKIYLLTIWESLYDEGLNSTLHEHELMKIYDSFNREHATKTSILELKMGGKKEYPWKIRRRNFKEQSSWWQWGVKILTAALDLQLVDPKIKDEKELFEEYKKLFKGATDIPSAFKDMYEEAKGLAIKVQPTPAA